ncbi:PaaI family thioesterase [Streptomyces iconiensis]|uniref:PaaI family thioesterase n=1 Tax=Streptomyces iconiensis TaxID=1384038 RepID=A0ABT7A377_9ACTN|nr:PaaI family thioesterase [Streptomyces iconiensis]MDJ1135788.1 PaaI family thioesterase [Streptomyces iconiensis]
MGQDPETKAGEWDGLSGLDVLKAMADGRLEHWNKSKYDEIGLRLTAAEPDHVTLSWRPTPATHNFAGGVDGGAIATVLDQVCCSAGATRTARACPMVTLSLNIDFTRPPHTGQLHEVRGELVHAGRHRMLVNGRIVNADGKTVAQATAAVVPATSVTPPQGTGSE